MGDEITHSQFRATDFEMAWALLEFNPRFHSEERGSGSPVA